MDADWYVDPLGRFDGRFFDGEVWTERVSNDGELAVDPDFPPLELDTTPEAPSGSANGFDSPEPAVAPVELSHLQASLIEESPARTVAVLDDAVMGASAGMIESPASKARSSRVPIVWALLGLITALVVAGLVLLNRDDSPAAAIAENVELDSDQAARVEDLEEGGLSTESAAEPIEELEVDAPTGAVAPGASFAPEEAIEVGGLRVVNGESVLTELRDWHQGFAAERGIELSPVASCWFGQLGGAAVQVAHCGPVGGSVDSEFTFDSVPLLFEDAPPGGQIAQPVVDAVMIDAVLSNALTLVGRDGDTPPIPLDSVPRGDRGDEDDDSGG